MIDYQVQHLEYSSIICQKQFVIALNVIKSLFYYTILTILALPVVCNVDFIVITGNILRSINDNPIVKPGRNIVSIPKIVISGFCPTHFTLTFAGQTIVDRYTGNIVKPKVVTLRFHCI